MYLLGVALVFLWKFYELISARNGKLSESTDVNSLRENLKQLSTQKSELIM